MTFLLLLIFKFIVFSVGLMVVSAAVSAKLEKYISQQKIGAISAFFVKCAGVVLYLMFAPIFLIQVVLYLICLEKTPIYSFFEFLADFSDEPFDLVTVSWR